MSNPEKASASFKPRILLVDDEAVLREHLAQTLSDDYMVDTAGNGAQALQAVLRARPDLVVTDIVMPEFDGLELLKTLRGTPSTQTIPVLLISGTAPDEVRIAGFEEGADGYLTKPHTVRELRARIRAVLRIAHLRLEAARRETREQAEQHALAERAALLESITDAFYAVDRRWRFTYINRRALEYFGKAREEVLGKDIWELFPSGKGTILQEQYERAMREQCSVAFEALSPLTHRWVDVHAYPTPYGLAVNFRDITESKHAEERLREAERRKDEFLAVLAHELRNPLTPIRNGLQILRLRATCDATSQATLGMLDRQLTHLVRLVDDLLDVSRVTHGRLELRKQRLPLREVLARAVEATQALIEAQQHELIIEIREQDIAVNGDPDRLVQVFCNLLSNSSKYTDAGGRISVTVHRQDDHAVVAVRDNGIGIAPEALGRVFDMFSQVSSGDMHTNGGLGIGLCLARTLVNLHQGSIAAASAGPGLGSTFTVRLPLAPSKAV